jgi:hypothetical protein
MTDVEIAEQTMTGIETDIASMTLACDLNRTRVEDIQRKIARLGYELHIGSNKDAEAQIDKLQQERLRLGNRYETLLGAIDGLRERLTAAQAAVARDVAAEHRAKARGIIKTLVEECAPALDATREHPDGTGPYHFSDPPTVARAGVLICSLLTELRALGLDNGARWGFVHQEGREMCTKEDARKELVRMLQTGWRYVPSAERRPLTPGRRQPSALPFVKMFGYWAQRLEGVLREPVEQSNEKERAA